MPTSTPVTTDRQGGCYRTLWEAVTTADHTGAAMTLPGAADRCVQVIGTFGGATVILEGSNNGGTTYAQLHDATGALISFTAAGIHAVLENPEMIRARLSVVGVGADVDVYMFSRYTQG
jgi:hypothetical protein